MADRDITFTIKMANQAKAVIADVTKDLKNMTSGGVGNSAATDAATASANQYKQTLSSLVTQHNLGLDAVKKYDAGLMAISKEYTAGKLTGEAMDTLVQKLTKSTIDHTSAVGHNATAHQSLMRQYREGEAGFDSFNNVIKIGIALLAGNELLNIADEYTALTGKIRTQTGSEQEAIAVRSKLVDISMATHTSLETNVEIYEKLHNAMAVYGKSQNDTLGVTKTLNEAFQLGGHSASAAATATMQFAFALQSGQVRGIEFNRILRESPELAKTMEAAMGKPTGYIREMIREGKLGTEELLNAVIKAGPEIDKKFAEMPMTIKKGLQDAKTGFDVFIGELGEKMQSSNSIGNFFSRIGAAFRDPTVIANALKIAQVIGNVLNVALTKLGDLFTTVANNANLLKAAFIGLTAVFAVQKIDGLVDAFIALYRTGKELPGLMGKIQKAVLAVMTVFEANPFVLLAVGIAAATAALVVFGDQIDASGQNAFTFKDVAIGAWDEFKNHVIGVYNDLTTSSDDYTKNSIKNTKDEAAEKSRQFDHTATDLREWYNEAVALMKFFELAGSLTFNNTWGAFEIMVVNMENALKHGVERMVNWFKDGMSQMAASAKEHGGLIGNGVSSILTAAGGDGKKFSLGPDTPDDDYMKAARAKAKTFQDFLDSPVRDAWGEEGRAGALKGIMGQGGGAAGAWGVGKGNDGGVDLNKPGTRQKLQPGKAKKEKKGPKDKSASEIQSIEDYIKKIQEAAEAIQRLAAAEWIGPQALRDAQVNNARLKEEADARQKLKDMKDGAAKNDLIKRAGDAAAFEETQKRLDAESKAFIKVRDAVTALNDATGQTVKSNAAILMFDPAQRAAYLHDLAVQNEILKQTNELRKQGYIIDAGGARDKDGHYKQTLADLTAAANASVNAKDQTTNTTAVRKLIDDNMRATEKATQTYKEAKAAYDSWMSDGTNKTTEEIKKAAAAVAKMKPPENLFDAIKTGMTSFKDDFEMTWSKVADGIKGTVGDIANAFVTMATTGKLNFGDLARTVIQDLLKMIAQALVFKAVMGIMNAVFPGLGSVAAPISSTLLGSAFGSSGGVNDLSGISAGFAPIHHIGGIAGQAAAAYRHVSSDMFASAARYHVGGIAGLKSGEVPIIANAGEAIMPTVRLPDGTFGVKATGAGGGGTSVFAPNIAVKIDASGGSSGTGKGAMDNADHQKLSKMLEDELNIHLARKLEQWQRPGGPLDRHKR